MGEKEEMDDGMKQRGSPTMISRGRSEVDNRRRSTPINASSLPPSPLPIRPPPLSNDPNGFFFLFRETKAPGEASAKATAAAPPVSCRRAFLVGGLDPRVWGARGIFGRRVDGLEVDFWLIGRGGSRFWYLARTRVSWAACCCLVR